MTLTADDIMLIVDRFLFFVQQNRVHLSLFLNSKLYHINILYDPHPWQASKQQGTLRGWRYRYFAQHWVKKIIQLWHLPTSCIWNPLYLSCGSGSWLLTPSDQNITLIHFLFFTAVTITVVPVFCRTNCLTLNQMSQGMEWKVSGGEVQFKGEK